MKQMGLIILLALGLVACNEGSSSSDKKVAAPATEHAHPAKEEAKKPAEAPATPAPAPAAAPTNVVKDVGKQVEQSITTGDAAIKKAAEGEEATKK